MALNGTSEEGTTEGKEEKTHGSYAPRHPRYNTPAALHRIHHHRTNPAQPLEPPIYLVRPPMKTPNEDPRPIVTGRTERGDNLALSARGGTTM